MTWISVTKVMLFRRGDLPLGEGAEALRRRAPLGLDEPGTRLGRVGRVHVERHNLAGGRGVEPGVQRGADVWRRPRASMLTPGRGRAW